MKTKIFAVFALLLAVVISGCLQTAGTGNIVMQITDRENLAIEKAEVTLSKIQVHVADADNETGWITVVEGPLTFDLIALKDVKEILGSKELSIGRYTQVRLDVDKALVTINGTQYNLTIPSKTVKLVRNFVIAENVTTTLTLDFDAQASIEETGNNNYIMKPTITVIQETPSEKEQGCINSGGKVVTSLCCKSVKEFPSNCAIGACGCSLENSHEIKTCDCGEGKCFGDSTCTEVQD